ncbi:MAG: hypothetical protein HW383_634 [Candidatus Magasanikbacteria bacterium]|nr:hypothetical protein [Candidatus Magasanikbacteria bacterium]
MNYNDLKSSVTVSQFKKIWPVIFTFVITAIVIGGGVYAWQNSLQFNSLQGQVAQLQKKEIVAPSVGSEGATSGVNMCAKKVAVKKDSESYVILIDGTQLEFTRIPIKNRFMPFDASNVALSADCQSIAWAQSYLLPISGGGKGWFSTIYFSGIDGSGYHVVDSFVEPTDPSSDVVGSYKLGNFATNTAIVNYAEYVRETGGVSPGDGLDTSGYWPERVTLRLLNLKNGVITNYGVSHGLSKNLQFDIVGERDKVKDPIVENIIVRDLPSGRTISRLRDKNGPTVFSFSFSPDSKFLAYIALDSKSFGVGLFHDEEFTGESNVYVLNLETGRSRSVANLQSGSPFYSIEWKDGELELMRSNQEEKYRVSADGSNFRKIQ